MNTKNIKLITINNQDIVVESKNNDKAIEKALVVYFKSCRQSGVNINNINSLDVEIRKNTK